MATLFAALSASPLLFLCWQLPTYDGTKSYQNLLVEVYGMVTSNRANYDTEIQQNPLNFIRSGNYGYSSGDVSNRSIRGIYWLPRIESANSARFLYFYSTHLYAADNYDKGSGYSLRCLVRLGHRQLPTYDGTKSYQNLLVGVYGGQYVSGNTGIDKADSFMKRPPTNFIRGGHYNYNSGRVSDRSSGGWYWYPNSTSTTRANRLTFGSDYLIPNDSYNKGQGFPLRCLAR